MRNYAEEVKEKLSIVDVVGGYVKLEKSGKNWKARCPFHNEKTPSFYVSEDRHSFNCFGCGIKGDVFTFIEKFEGVDFKGALKTLAERAGIDIRINDNKGDKDERDRLFKMLEEATLFFEKGFEDSKEAQSYIEKRGVKDAMVKEMRIGFAPDEWRHLRSYMKSKKYSDAELVSVGLIKQAPGGKEPYDVFRGRVIFPIADSSGRIVAFTGRILKDDPKAPKYLNSPETTLYSKTKVLYGLDKAKQHIRKVDYAILVEGQMDLIMSHQAGLRNTVAVSGTALADDVVRSGDMTGLGLITRLSRNLIVAFDSDNAGVKAALRAAHIGLSLGLDVKIAYPEGGKDPADIIKEDAKKWAEAIKKSVHAAEFALDRILEKKPELKDLGKMVIADVLPMIALSSSSIEQSRLVELVANKAGLKSDALWKDLLKLSPSLPLKPGQIVSEQKETITRRDRLLRMAFGIMFSEKTTAGEFGKTLREVAGVETYNAFLGLGEAEKSSLATEVEVLYGEHGPNEKSREELVHTVIRDNLKLQRDEIGKALKIREKDGKNTDALLKEYLELSKRISE